MLECKLWHIKAVSKTVKGANMVEFIKTCNQYPHKFNFGHFFSSLIVSSPSPISAGGNTFSKKLDGGKGFVCGLEQK